MKPGHLFYFFAFVLLGTACRKNRALREDGEFRFADSIQVDGRWRSFVINLPPDYYEGGSFPLIIALHGGGGHAEQFESSTGLTEKANASGFAVVYPNGVKSTGFLKVQTWNAGGCCEYAMEQNIDDVKFISSLIDRLTAKFAINNKRVYATGHSNGGIMAYRLACELSGKIAAIAPNASTMMLESCNPSKPVPVLHMHSELDERVPYLGGRGTGFTGADFPAVDAILSVWSEINGCSASPVTTGKENYTVKEWQDCNHSSIQYYLTKDGGHSWPGGKPGRLGADEPSAAIDANDLMLAFFSKY
ncbi:MAG: hypothetical protein KIT80_00965 [Chitinophagaceae bacterium]|nr:hypothetical protein [Chitinophagaceae bacterium]MCW5925461.1 hypothetical protein [Chitinophagaceae bacterium]